MSQESNLNLIHRYEESLNSSEVINARELKFCEGCGVLVVRVRGSKAQFCPDCEQQMAIAIRRMQ
jgi:membrane protease subunit (stomatin/prohibitin family)